MNLDNLVMTTRIRLARTCGTVKVPPISSGNDFVEYVFFTGSYSVIIKTVYNILEKYYNQYV